MNENFDGNHLQQFYDKVTNFGEKPGGIGLIFVHKYVVIIN